MTTVFLRTIILIACVGLSSAVSGAESNVVNLWECSVNDGKTMKDVEAANSKWVKFANIVPRPTLQTSQPSSGSSV